MVRRYGSGPAVCTALDGISLAIQSGQFIALTGPSGSGKSTLLNVLGGLDRTDAGEVWFEDRELSTLSDAEISNIRLHRIGFVFQDGHLVPVLSVAENIELPLLFRQDIARTERNQRVAQAMRDVGLWDKRHRRPDELSGGERQRASLARALGGRPSVVLADEPTANLDQHTGAAVIRLMRALCARYGSAVVCATHDGQLTSCADQVVRLSDGRMMPS